MIHYAAPSFWSCFESLPAEIQDLARKNYDLLVIDPGHPSLHLKRVGRYCPVRVGLHYRALGKPVADGVLWGWIGTHAEYNRLTR
ncbi:MAG TPA: hypothetical protein VF698_01380 [Thermoanaerobaculia bacterium]